MTNEQTVALAVFNTVVSVASLALNIWPNLAYRIRAVFQPESRSPIFILQRWSLVVAVVAWLITMLLWVSHTVSLLP